MQKYNPESLRDRHKLAKAIIDKLIECGFKEEDSSGERIFYRVIPHSNRKVVVYTSVVDDCIRSCGKDAIRISGLHMNSEGKWLGIIKNIRVNRIGDIDSIVNRMYQRMRDTYGRLMNPELCKCGSLKFVSKKGNLVCSEFCWVK